jgi:hypothetical protein
LLHLKNDFLWVAFFLYSLTSFYSSVLRVLRINTFYKNCTAPGIALLNSSLNHNISVESLKNLDKALTKAISN